MNFVDKLLCHDPKSVAINGISYGELTTSVNQAANALTTKGITKGDVLFLHGDNTLEMVILWLAGVKAGAVLMLASVFHTDSEVTKMSQSVRLKLTDNEILKIGTFPLDYNFSRNNVQYLVGMSVPPVMMAHIADQVFNQWISKIN